MPTYTSSRPLPRLSRGKARACGLASRVRNGVDQPPAWNLWACADWVSTTISVNAIAIASAAVAARELVRKSKLQDCCLWCNGFPYLPSGSNEIGHTGQAQLDTWEKEARGSCFSRGLRQEWVREKAGYPLLGYGYPPEVHACVWWFVSDLCHSGT